MTERKPDDKKRDELIATLRCHAGLMLASEVHPRVREVLTVGAQAMTSAADILEAARSRSAVAELPEPAGWRREWDGDVSDLGQWVEAWSREDLDEHGPWEPLFTETQVLELLASRSASTVSLRDAVIEECAKELDRQAKHFDENAERMRKPPFADEAEARARELGASMVREAAWTLRTMRSDHPMMKLIRDVIDAPVGVSGSAAE